MPKNNIAANKEKTIPYENDFNEKDMMMDVLTSTKALLNLYHTFASETSNKTLYDKIQTLHKETSLMQRDLYNLMFEFGWYQLEIEPASKVQKKYKQLSTLGKQLS